MRLWTLSVGYEWRKWFAWRPVVSEDYKIYWLTMMEKKIFNCPLDNVRPPSWVIYRKFKRKQNDNCN